MDTGTHFHVSVLVAFYSCVPTLHRDSWNDGLMDRWKVERRIEGDTERQGGCVMETKEQKASKKQAKVRSTPSGLNNAKTLNPGRK